MKEKMIDNNCLTSNQGIKGVMPKPFIKWAGGKGKLLPILREFYPYDLGISIKKYCEPMVGAGAVLFDILSRYEMEEVYICDINIELINVYKTIKYKIYELLCILSEFENIHIQKDEKSRKEYYLLQREKFNNEIKNPTEENSVLRASLFIYLNKTCFNGLYRVNKSGLFNVPVGSYKNPKICDVENLKNVSLLLSNVNILSGNYTNIKKYIDENTFVYFDPPYRPLTNTSKFTSYNSDPFNDNEQVKLSEFVKIIKYAKFMISNSDPKNIDENDNFFDDLYSQFNINRIFAPRFINSKSSGRGKISELLITNYGV